MRTRIWQRELHREPSLRHAVVKCDPTTLDSQATLRIQKLEGQTRLPSMLGKKRRFSLGMS
jgi:hypothetical protein